MKTLLTGILFISSLSVISQNLINQVAIDIGLENHFVERKPIALDSNDIDKDDLSMSYWLYLCRSDSGKSEVNSRNFKDSIRHYADTQFENLNVESKAFLRKWRKKGFDVPVRFRPYILRHHQPYYMLSRPVYSNDSCFAVIEYSVHVAPLVASGYRCYYLKINGKWNLMFEELTWIS